MAHDDWRIRIELPDEEVAQDLLARLGLRQSDAEELADELREHRLAVSQDGDTVFVYAATGMQAEQAARIVESELDDLGLTPTRFVTERWLRDEERQQLRSEGYDVSRTFTYVIAGAGSREEAVELARRIHGEVEPGGELVYEVQPQNPFAVFGGLGT
ncbi:MAG: hypothetical protein E6G09_05220 [Actinobacteria bacterium]|nr:MAG: hypothetical protein E6G09_05220 [Actinomycetota bacterium]